MLGEQTEPSAPRRAAPLSRLKALNREPARGGSGAARDERAPLSGPYRAVPPSRARLRPPPPPPRPGSPPADPQLRAAPAPSATASAPPPPASPGALCGSYINQCEAHNAPREVGVRPALLSAPGSGLAAAGGDFHSIKKTKISCQLDLLFEKV
ncbi:sterile alpha motif domain-containing protein 1-like [Gallus gallus]|uniref:sterile alpha motif domain-containing protein 1-like n=1 Tax=Gallus gallus TaxID=9031 RepID=UPI001F00A69C|nr:sterile alpha motif domain-containing protein 1-like [Gallus gallus]XP_046798494.1 sterile alpha motif domain-containing protein 1-like [Gallus gallus]